MPTEILVVLLLVVCVIILIILIKALKSAFADSHSAPKAPATPTGSAASAKPSSAPTPTVIYNMKTKQLPPQVTVYANPTNPNAFRCPVCDSRPAPSAKYCQVCGQVFQPMGGK